MFSNCLMCVLKCYCSMADSDLQGRRVSSHLDPNPGITPSPTQCRSRTLMRDFCLICYALLRGESRNFWLGGSKLWFWKDCWTFLLQITSNRYNHILWYVNPGCHWYWKYCFASRGERIIQGYPKTKLHFWISVELSIVAKCNAHFDVRISVSNKRQVWWGGGGGSRPSPGSATVTRIQSTSFNRQRPKTTATLHQE